MPVTASKKPVKSNKVTPIKAKQKKAAKTVEKLTQTFENSGKIKPAAKAKKATVKKKAVKKETTAKKTKAANDVTDNFQQASEAFSKASKEMLAVATENFEQNMQAAKDSLQAKDANHLLAIQSKLFQQNLENCIKQTTKLNELYFSKLKR